MKKDNFSNNIPEEIVISNCTKKYKNQVDDNENIGEKIKVLVLGLLIGIVFDMFFINKYIGISAFLFTTMFIGISVWTVSSKVDLSKKLSWMFLISTILLSMTYSIYNNPLLRVLNVIVIPFLISGYILSVRYENIKQVDLYFIRKMISRLAVVPFENFDKGAKFSKEIIRTRTEENENTARKAILRGLLISLPLLLIIVNLLTSADAMFSYHINNIIEGFDYVNIAKFTRHFVFILFIAMYSIGSLWSLKYKEENVKISTGSKHKWNSVTVMTVLFSISIVYLLFSIVQISYLYGGSQKVIESGYTYAEYARRGFFELVLVALINFTILISSIKFTKVDGQRTASTLKATYSLLIVFTFNMITSAFYKMNLYEKAFGYTILRILVQIFIVYLGILLVILLFKVWRKSFKPLRIALIVSMVFYMAINFMNIDKVIAKNNIDRYIETGDIDMYYMIGLSYDSIDELKRLLELEGAVVLRGSYFDTSSYKEGENTEYIDIKDFVKNHINERQKYINETNNKWYEYNYYRNKMKGFKLIIK